MSAPWNRWDWDYLWHFLAGLGSTAGIVGLVQITNAAPWLPLLMIPLLLVGGVVRELSQHEWSWSEMTGHRWLEGVLWGIGGLVAAGVGLVFLL